ncbi:MAG: DUF1801 domain-containing protein [Saprospiraceae bacterium]
MSKNKTTANDDDVIEFLNNVANEQRRNDSFKILEIMKEVTDETPVMWGNSIIGFGSYHYKYESGREGDFMLTGFSPRKTSLTIYCMTGFNDELMQSLGKYKTGKSCLYVKKLTDIDEEILKKLILKSITRLKEKYG